VRELGAAVREEALAGLDDKSRKRLLSELGWIKTNLQAALSGDAIAEDGERRHG